MWIVYLSGVGGRRGYYRLGSVGLGVETAGVASYLPATFIDYLDIEMLMIRWPHALIACITPRTASLPVCCCKFWQGLLIASAKINAVL